MGQLTAGVSSTGKEEQGIGGGAGYQVYEGREAGLGRGGSGGSSACGARGGGGGGGGGGLMELGQLKSRKAKILLLLRNLCLAPTCK